MPGGLRKKRVGGRRVREGRLVRSEPVTLRVDEKLLYLIELAARKHKWSVSSYLEWAAERSLKEVLLTTSEGTLRSIADESEELWHPDKVVRFVKLASRHPDLLTYHQSVLWKLIRENQFVWPRSRQGQMAAEPDINFLRSCWDRFVAVAEGKADRSILPGEADSAKPFPTAGRDFNGSQN
jgi:hypothetical protein